MALRIWQQSSLDIKQLPGYAAFLRTHSQTVCASDVTVDVHGIETGPWQGAEYFKYSGEGEHLKVAQIVENALRAERDGFDAVAISCFLDTGVEEARRVVSIPVVGMMEVSLEVATKAGQALALMTRASHMTRRVSALIREYGFESLVAAHTPLDFTMSLPDLDRAYGGNASFVDRFVRQAAALVGSGADTIVPAEGVLNTVLVANGVTAIDGMPVFDAYGTLLAYAEMLVRLRRKHAARASPKVPERVATALRRATGDLLSRS